MGLGSLGLGPDEVGSMSALPRPNPIAIIGTGHAGLRQAASKPPKGSAAGLRAGGLYSFFKGPSKIYQ